MDKAHKLIAKAADVLETKGWTQHQMIDEDTGCVCAFHALRVAAIDLWPGILSTQAIEVLNARVIVSNAVGSGMMRWNDDVRQTKDDVIATLRDIAES